MRQIIQGSVDAVNHSTLDPVLKQEELLLLRHDLDLARPIDCPILP